MQTITGEEAVSLCKEEFQLFFTEFLVPIVDKALRERIQRENSESPIPKYRTGYGYITLEKVVQYAAETLGDAYRGLQRGLWQSHANVPESAYQPNKDRLPFFVTLDNGPAHSFWLGPHDWLQHMHSIGISLLQVLYVCPHGHDLHQTVEHVNGVIKREARKELARLTRSTPDLSKKEGCKVVFDTVEKQEARVCEQEFVDNNLERLKATIAIAAAKKNEELLV